MPINNVTHVLKTAIRVYALATTFQLKPLSELVAEAFMARESYFANSVLVAVIKTLLDTVPADDINLRKRVIDRCVANYGVIRRYHPKVEILMLEITPAVWRLGLEQFCQAGIAQTVAKMMGIRLLVKEGDHRRSQDQVQELRDAVSTAETAAQVAKEAQSTAERHLHEAEKAAEAEYDETLERTRELLVRIGQLQTVNKALVSTIKKLERENKQERESKDMLAQDHADREDVRRLSGFCRTCGRPVSWAQPTVQRDDEDRLDFRCLCGRILNMTTPKIATVARD